MQSKSRRAFDGKKGNSSTVKEKAKRMRGTEIWKLADFLIER